MKLKKLKPLLFLLFTTLVSAHGVSSASARIEKRPANLIEIKVQFNLIDLLNHDSKKYSLPLIASLSDANFEIFYKEIIKLFQEKLLIQIGKNHIKSHNRFPSASQMFALIKREFIERKFSKNRLYTFSDRRFYHVFYFDFLLQNEKDLKKLSIKFPEELGTVYTTFTQSTNQEIHHGRTWRYKVDVFK